MTEKDLFTLADDEWNMGNVKEAFKLFCKAAMQNDDSAQNNLGYFYDNGIGTKKDEDKALYWYKKAFRNGNIAAINNIATIYRDRGNNRRAFFWYKKAVDAGDKDALVEIGERYYKGEGIKRDYKLAVECFRKAIKATAYHDICEDSQQKAMSLLGIAYSEGKGVKRSIARSKMWIERAR